MQLLTKPRPNKWPAFFYTGVPLAFTAILWWLSPYQVSVSQAAAGFVLAWIPWISYQKWSKGERRDVPLFVLIAGMFWLAYATPLFLSGRSISAVNGGRQLSEDSITLSLYLAVLGVLAIAVGMKVVGSSRRVPRLNFDLPTDPARWNYIRVALVLGILLRVFVPVGALGAEARQIIVNLESMLPGVTFAILFRYFLVGKCPGVDRVLVFGYLAVALFLGIASGWMGSFIGVGVTCAAIYIYERRKPPIVAALIILPAILFFQPAKEAFRVRFWEKNSDADQVQKISFWVNHSWNMWNNALSDASGTDAKDLARRSLDRLSLLRQTANVIELTPDIVPYQYGRLYSYLAVTFIPRFVWPSKPSVNDANRWYQVTYRLTRSNDLRGVSIAVGTLAESYINFGWFGPILIMLPLGIFLGTFQRIFLRSDSGLFLSSVGAVLIPQLLAVDSQMAEYVAGLAQQILIVLVVLLPLLKFRTRGKNLAARFSLKYQDGIRRPASELTAEKHVPG